LAKLVFAAIALLAMPLLDAHEPASSASTIYFNPSASHG